MTEVVNEVKVELSEEQIEKELTQPFIDYVKNGEYQKKQGIKNFLEVAKEQLKEELSSSTEKRHEYEDIDMIAKFVPKKLYSVDQQGLIEELSDYLQVEWLGELLTLDTKLLQEQNRLLDVAAFQDELSYYFKPTLNKVGKSFLKKEEWLFGGQSKRELLLEIQSETEHFKKSEATYKEIMASLSLNASKTMKTEVGTLSRVANKPVYNLAEIHDVYGEDFLKSFCKVQLQKLDEYILMEIIPKKVLENHRTLIDIRLDFTVMRLSDERRVLEALSYQKKMLQQKYA